jgi:hypothetical protein
MALQGAAAGQSVPQGIHSDATGPTEMCGVTAATAPEFEEAITRDASFREEGGNDLYRAFNNADRFIQWVFSTPKNPAHPLATCRRLVSKDGNIYAGREMRCDASREACDRAFLQFQALDEGLRRALMEK